MSISLKDFQEKLRVLLNIENQELNGLSRMITFAQNEDVSHLLDKKLQESFDQNERIDLIVKNFGTHQVCHEGSNEVFELLKESLQQIAEDASYSESSMLKTLKKCSDFKIGTYEEIIKDAHELGYDEIAKELQKTIDEEQEMMEKTPVSIA